LRPRHWASGPQQGTSGTSITPVSDPDKRVLSRRVARGVYAVVTPWNFPVNIPTEYLAPALATGNAVVWIPAPTTSHVAVLLTRIIASVGLPPGTLNLVTGPGPVVGDAAVAHPGVHGVGFTGSSVTGAHIARRAAGKAQLLELGGNGPTIVLDDADLDAAADAIAAGAFFNAGQTCAATEVVLVERGVHDELARLLADRARGVVLGAGTDGAATMGPLNNEGVAAKMDEHVADALERGATRLTGGGRSSAHPGRLFYEPTVLSAVPPQARLVREESFGPIVPLVPVDSADAALEIASGPEFGLVSSVWSRSARRAFEIAEELRSGIVNINDSSTWWEIHVPFGGGSGTLSGTGRLGGMHTLLEMTEIKTITFAVSSF
jgi:succinate-semialdehyde dehydrogenase/glutarate-semialdehyde dehydrogenase